MKKCLSITVAIILIMGTIMVPAYAADIDDSLIFELDFSAYNPQTKTGIKNAVTNSSADISVVSGTSGNVPVVVNDNISGTPIKALQFRAADGTNAATSVEIADATLLGKAELSVEIMFKPYSQAETYCPIVAFYNNDYSANSFVVRTQSKTAASLFVEPTGSAQTITARTSPSFNSNSWNHIIVTRKYDASTGKWNESVYMNGSKVLNNRETLAQVATVDAGSTKVSIGGKGVEKTFAGVVSSVKIYNAVMTDEEALEAYNRPIFADTMEVYQITPDLSGISASPGTITINFNNYIKKDTASDISFTLADGSPLLGKISIAPTADKYTKKVNIKYGSLTEGESYKITIGAGVKSVNNIGYTGETEFIFSPTTLTTAIFEEDFSGDEYVVNEAPPTDGFFTYTSSGREGNDATDFAVLQTESGDKYVAGISTTLKKNTMMKYDFNPDITSGAIAFEIGVRGFIYGSEGAGSVTREILRFYSPGNTYKAVAYMNGAPVIAGEKSSTPADDGFNYIKVVLTPDENGKYLYDFYPDASKSESYRIDNAIDLNAVGSVMLAHCYPQKEIEVMSGFAITSFKAYYVTPAGIIGGTSGTINKTDEVLEVWFDSEMDVTSVEDADYVLKTADGAKSVAVEFERYDAELRTAYVVIRDNLDMGTEYYMSVEGARSTAGILVNGKNAFSVKIAESPNKPENAEIAPATIGDTSVTANIALPAAAQVTYSLIVFDANGRVKASKSETVSGTSNTVALTVANGLLSGDTAKLIIWETSGGYKIPVTSSPITITTP